MLRLALAQIDIALGNPQANLTKLEQLAQQASANNAHLLALPELWSTGYALDQIDQLASTPNEGLFDQMQQISNKYQLALTGSILGRLPNGKIANTAVFLIPNKPPLPTYNKLHLFRLMKEDQFLTAGETAVLWETPWGKAGAAICYDLRFPELFRTYAFAGAEMIFLPAEWPHPRLSHWQTLLRARAIENQLFVIACNRVGQVRKTEFFGHSTVVDPWGELLVEGDETESLLFADLDLSLVQAAREKIPVFQDTRPIYLF